MKIYMILPLLLAFAAGAQAEPIPYPVDGRIRTIDYLPNQVITVPVSTGVVTRVVLERGEKIIAGATGVPAKCDSEAHQWCIVADADANEVWIKPKLGARHNNLELKTDRRDYSFDFEVGAVKTYRLALRYPTPATEPHGPSDEERVAARLASAEPVMKNKAYTLEGNRKGADITPKAIFDDGNFTYFKFPGNSEVPTIFIIGSDGKEARSNFNMAGDYVVVQRTGRKFVLRLGKSVVSVFNQGFDTGAVMPTDGTTVAGIAREDIGADHAN
jgi:type IV secretion system protein VirB9